MKVYVLNYLRLLRSAVNGYTVTDKLLIFLTCLLYITYPLSLLSMRATGRALNIWKILSRYSFCYRGFRFASPGGISAIIALKSSEPSVRSILEEIRNHGDAVDVGANIGFYTVILSHIVGSHRKVVSIEPDSLYYPYLLSNLLSNQCANVIALHLACWSSEASLSLERPRIGVALDSHVREETGDHSSLVIARKLDSILADYHCHPSVVKIDVEGSEAEVLLGMTETMSRDMPVIVFEARLTTIDLCRTILTHHGYEVRLLPDGNFLAEPMKREASDNYRTIEDIGGGF